MKKYARALSLWLAGLMLLGLAVGCRPKNPDTGEQTAPDTEPEQTVDTEAEATITPPIFEVGELSLAPKQDLFPEFQPTEVWEQHAAVAVEIYTEAEAYDSTTLPFSQIRGEEYSGGIMMQALTAQAPLQGWDAVYSVDYTVNAPAAGRYRLVVLSSDLSKEYTSDYFVEVNGNRQIEAAKSYSVLENFQAAFDAGLFKVMDLGTLQLEQGENVITFVVDNADSQISWDRISFFMDYFKLTYMAEDAPAGGAEITYAVQPTGENAQILQAAAGVNVFDSSYPLRLSVAANASEAGEMTYTVTDYFGDTLYSGSTQVTGAGTVVLEKTVKDHPTGYFVLRMGDVTHSYVVLSTLGQTVPEESPFAMDYASYYLVKDLDKAYAIACAARMAGVTWVRDRADWRTYEQSPGQYDFTSTEQVWKVIDQAGLKNLAMLCTTPAWASQAGGFAQTQLEIYQTTKAMATYYKDLVDAWELWNESDHGFALETAELYAAWYKAAAMGVLDADPNAIVSFGGLCQPDANIDYMHMMFMNDVMEYSSIFNYHAHTPQGLDLPDFSRFAMVSGTFASLSHYNTQNKPVWLTEAGMKIMTETPGEKQKTEQAPYIVTSTVQSLAMGTEKHFWFVLAPYLEAGGDFGTFGANYQPYPTLAAENTMTHVLGKAQYLGELYDLPNRAFGYVFYTGSRAVSVLWSQKNALYTIETEQPVILTDIMGNQTLVQPENGKITLRLTTNPVFVTYSQAPAYQNKQYPDAEIQPLQLGVGERVVLSPNFEGYDINDANTKHDGHIVDDGSKIVLYVTNFNDTPVTGRVSVTVEGFTVTGCEQEITVPSMGRVEMELTLHRTTESDVNTYILFSGEFNGEQTSASVAHIHTNAPEKDNKVKFTNLRESKQYGTDVLSDIGIRFSATEGDVVAYLNGSRFDAVSYDGTEITVDLSGLPEGRHTVVCGLQTSAGDFVYTVFYVTYQDDTVTFAFS